MNQSSKKREGSQAEPHCNMQTSVLYESEYGQARYGDIYAMMHLLLVLDVGFAGGDTGSRTIND